jgi:hypothetical protein
MPDEATTGTATGQQPAGTGTDTGAEKPGAQTQTQTSEPTPERKYTDADMAKARRQAEAAQTAAEKRAEDLTARLAALEAEDKKRKDAELTEAQRKDQALQAAQEEAAQTKARLAEIERWNHLQGLAGKHAPHLPESEVTVTLMGLDDGASDEVVQAALAEAAEKFETAEVGRNAEHLTWLLSQTPDQILAATKDLPDAAKRVYQQLAERLAGRPVSIGAPAGAGAAPVPPQGSDAFRQLAGNANLDPSARQKAWLDAVSARRTA